MTTLKPLVSVIITTKNEEKHIENCLKSLKAQTYSPDKIEIIVVDCARVIKADIFKNLKGFDESLIGPEDWDLDKRPRAEPVIFHNESVWF